MRTNTCEFHQVESASKLRSNCSHTHYRFFSLIVNPLRMHSDFELFMRVQKAPKPRGRTLVISQPKPKVREDGAKSIRSPFFPKRQQPIGWLSLRCLSRAGLGACLASLDGFPHFSAAHLPRSSPGIGWPYDNHSIQVPDITRLPRCISVSAPV